MFRFGSTWEVSRPMVYTLIHVALHLTCDAFQIRAVCRVMDMRDDRLFAALAFVAFGCLAAATETERSTLYYASLAFIIILPIACSKRSLRSRLTRYLLIQIMTFFPMLLAIVLYALAFAGEPFPKTIDMSNLGPTLAMYAFTIPASALTMEALISFFAWLDGTGGESFGIPVFAWGAGVIFIIWLLEARTTGFATCDDKHVLFVLAFNLLSILTAMALTEIAQRDARAQREAADRAAAARQVRHLRYQVVAATTRSLSVRRLRHDLANQVGVVRELAAAGRGKDADRYLAALQERARGL